MRALETPATPSAGRRSEIRWKRIVLAAFLSEVTVIAVLSAVMAVHRFVIAPGETAAQFQEFAQRASYDTAAPAAAVATFIFAFWAVRRLESGFIANGILVGAVATLLTLGFIAGARREDRPMYVVSYVLRLAAGWAAGLAARQMTGAADDQSRQVR